MKLKSIIGLTSLSIMGLSCFSNSTTGLAAENDWIENCQALESTKVVREFQEEVNSSLEMIHDYRDMSKEEVDFYLTGAGKQTINICLNFLDMSEEYFNDYLATGNTESRKYGIWILEDVLWELKYDLKGADKTFIHKTIAKFRSLDDDLAFIQDFDRRANK